MHYKEYSVEIVSAQLLSNIRADHVEQLAIQINLLHGDYPIPLPILAGNSWGNHRKRECATIRITISGKSVNLWQIF